MIKIHRKNRIKSLFRDKRGATAIEYAIIIGGLAFVILGSVNFVGDAIEDTMQHIKATLSGESTAKWDKKDDIKSNMKGN
ncbi:MAG: Flp family type IVb pilin [Alphaproteobacteria bacterium]|nr:Flp family type IVb pilin [Alphaproteobacteria bacterium]